MQDKIVTLGHNSIYGIRVILDGAYKNISSFDVFKCLTLEDNEKITIFHSKNDIGSFYSYSEIKQSLNSPDSWIYKDSITAELL